MLCVGVVWGLSDQLTPAPPPLTTRRFERPNNRHLVLFLIGSCCLGDGSFLPQHKIGSRVNPFILLGRITVLNEMYETAKLIAAIDERAEKEGHRRLMREEKKKIKGYEKRLDKLPDYVHGKPGDGGRLMPAQYLSSVGNLCMTVAKYTRTWWIVVGVCYGVRGG